MFRTPALILGRQRKNSNVVHAKSSKQTITSKKKQDVCENSGMERSAVTRTSGTKGLRKHHVPDQAKEP